MNQYDKFDCDFWTLFLTHSHIFKCFGKTQDCTSASKHPGQPQESLQPVIPFKMLAPWPEEDLLPVSFPKPHNCWNSLHFCWRRKEKKTQVPVSHKLLPSLFYTQSQTSPHVNWALRSLQSNWHFWSQIVMNYKIWVANPWTTQHLFILPQFWRNCT